MTDFEVQLAGRLSAIEYVLEVLMANELSFQAKEYSDQFKRELAKRPGRGPARPVDAALLSRVAAETEEALTRFLERVDRREAELRNQR